MRILRVFPHRTKLTPRDELVFIGDPPLFRPPADEVHVSVTFTWDVTEGKRLQAAWSQYYPVVKIGGPAFGNQPAEFIPGKYIAMGVTFTSRGCNNQCPWCLVPGSEGKLFEIQNFAEGYVVQDNNLLQCSRQHIEKVFAMLRKQKRATVFSGGLQANLVDDWFVDQLGTIRLDSLFLAADTDGALRPLERALKKLVRLDRRKKRVYCMIGRQEIPETAKERLETIWELGGLPFAQLYQPLEERYLEYPERWRKLAWEWSRPAAMFANHH